MPKIRYFITADYAVVDEMTKKLSVSGFFDTFRIVLFPSPAPKFFIVLGVYDIEKSVDLILNINAPNGVKIAETFVNIKANSVNDVINHIIAFDQLPLLERGTYQVNIIDSLNDNIISSYYFSADFPLERILTDEEKQEILNSSNALKGSRIQLNCPKCNKEYKFEFNLDPQAKIEEGWSPFPVNDRLECCGQQIDLTGIRRQIMWSFGQKVNLGRNSK